VTMVNSDAGAVAAVDENKEMIMEIDNQDKRMKTSSKVPTTFSHVKVKTETWMTMPSYSMSRNCYTVVYIGAVDELFGQVPTISQLQPRDTQTRGNPE
jgi:hypothetical protein